MSEWIEQTTPEGGMKSWTLRLKKHVWKTICKYPDGYYHKDESIRVNGLWTTHDRGAYKSLGGAKYGVPSERVS
jgi:hypothetical protein